MSAPPEDLLYAECLGGFGAIDYQAFTTPDKVEQVKAFYEKVGTQQWLEEVSGGVRFKRFKEQTTICFKGFGRNVHRPTNLVVILDPANPDDSERLGQLYPASLTNHTLLIFVMRGYVSQEG